MRAETVRPVSEGEKTSDCCGANSSVYDVYPACRRTGVGRVEFLRKERVGGRDFSVCARSPGAVVASNPGMLAFLALVPSGVLPRVLSPYFFVSPQPT